MHSLPVYKDEIEELFSPTFYRRGAAYFKRGRVVKLTYDKVEQVWKGKVIGSDIYNVKIGINPDHLEYSCDCPAYDDFGQCKHIVACLLAIEQTQSEDNNNIVTERIKKRDQQKAINHFVQVFSNIQQTEAYSREHVLKQTLQVEFIIKTQSQFAKPNLWTIEIKVGAKRTYVVKDLKSFLLAVEQQTNYYFTKNFTYDPTEHEFTANDFEVIKLLQAIIKNEIAYTGSYYRKDERAATIPPMVVDNLLSLLQQTNYTFESVLGIHHQIEVIDSEPPFHFRLDKGVSNDFLLNITELMNMQFYEVYNYVLKDGVLYKLTTNQKEILLELYSGFMKSGTAFLDDQAIPIEQDQMESFLSVVIPEMEKVGHLEIAESVSNQIKQFPLQPKIMIDRDQDTLQVDVEYHYGDVIINPFQTTVPETDGLIIRDMRKEQEIMTAIEDASLKYNGKKLYVDGEEEIFYFLFHTLSFLEDKAEIFLTSAVKALLVTTENMPETTFDFDQDGSLLEVSFDMKDIDQDHIQQILQSVIEKKNYYRLPNGAFIAIKGNEQFDQISQLYTDLHVSQEEIEDGKVQLPVYRALQVDDIIQENTKNKVRIGKQFRRLINNLKNPDELDFALPEGLQAELRDYQVIGFEWLKTLAHYTLGGILADDMGLGKTLQAISFLLSEKQESEQLNPALIVAPASLVYNWKAEFEKFAPDLSVKIVIGTPSERQAILESSEFPDVLVTSYPTLRQDQEWYKDHQFSSLFLDEAQAIKNALTKTSKAVRTIKASKRFALSGTPIENSLDELWAIFQAILPGFFPAQHQFRKLSEEKISKMVRPFILRRLKQDVLTELPDKIESTHVSELTTEQKGLYMSYLERIQQETKETLDSEGLNKNRIKILAGLTRLRQLCCHPGLFLENYQGTSGKLEQLLEIVNNAKENKKRMLIFSQFTSMLHIIRGELDKAGINYFYIDGQTPSKERVEMVERFNQGENDIFLISLKAGGTGLNLTGADTVILYDLWWNPAVEEQAAGRAHRMGQKNVVQVIRLLTKGTIEEKIYQLQQRKKELIEKVIQPGEAMLSSITEEEIRELLSI